MLDNIILENLLVFDIETVPQYGNFNDLPEPLKELWMLKGRRIAKEGETIPDDFFYDRAGIYAEFGKVICISAGYFKKSDISGQLGFRVKTFASENEREVLLPFKGVLDKHYSTPEKGLCGHNSKEFDIPYLCRRMLINGIQLPAILDLFGKKPWEVQHIDTMQLWKFGDVKSYTSLRLLATIFNIPTPKDDIDGNDVGRVFWVEKNLPRIVRYCQKDVVTVAQLLLRFKGLPLMNEQDIVVANGEPVS
ncbi:MAG TPA: 3'-5' exonuclease [Chitinophagales bacterium]|nr:3'-5' exonuclease [Chitinophagales bacterium]